MIRELKDGMLIYTYYVCPDCGEREGHKFNRDECICKFEVDE